MLYVCSQQGDIYNRSIVTEKTNTDVTFSVASVGYTFTNVTDDGFWPGRQGLLA